MACFVLFEPASPQLTPRHLVALLEVNNSDAALTKRRCVCAL